jgi:hypothetical protein
MNETEFTTFTAKTYKIIKEVLLQPTRDNSLVVWSNVLGVNNEKQLILDKLDEFFILLYNAKKEISLLDNAYNRSGINVICKIQQAIFNNTVENSVNQLLKLNSNPRTWS